MRNTHHQAMIRLKYLVTNAGGSEISEDKLRNFSGNFFLKTWVRGNEKDRACVLNFAFDPHGAKYNGQSLAKLCEDLRNAGFDSKIVT